MRPVRHRVRAAGQIPLEHPADGVGAAAGDAGDLCDRVALGAQQDHLVAGAGGGIPGGLVAAVQFVVGGLVQPHTQRRRHARPPCDQETLTMHLINQHTQPLSGSI
jgi:predicted acyltransferase